MEHVASPERRAKLAVVPPHPLDDAYRRTGNAPQPIDVLRHCAETPGEFAVLVFPSRAVAVWACDAAFYGLRIFCKKQGCRVFFENGSEARFVGADEQVNMLGREFSLLWLHADVAESAVEGVRVRPREAHASPHGATFAKARKLADAKGIPFDDAIRQVEARQHYRLSANGSSAYSPDAWDRIRQGLDIDRAKWLQDPLVRELAGLVGEERATEIAESCWKQAIVCPSMSNGAIMERLLQDHFQAAQGSGAHARIIALNERRIPMGLPPIDAQEIEPLLTPHSVERAQGTWKALAEAYLTHRFAMRDRLSLLDRGDGEQADAFIRELQEFSPVPLVKPPGASMDVIPPPKPKPAPGPRQVWAFTDGMRFQLGPFTVREVRPDGEVMLSGTSETSRSAATLETNPGWHCIGVETSNGKVMVGESRQEGETVYTVVAVADARRVRVRCVADDVTFAMVAEDFAEWALVDATPKTRAPAPSDDIVPPTPLSTSLAGTPVPCPPTPHYRCPKCRAATCFAPAGPPAAALAESSWRCDVCRQVSSGDELIPLATAKPVDPREERRREIEAVLREDARRHPEFAEARRAAVLARAEENPGFLAEGCGDTAESLVEHLRVYERLRGVGGQPHQAAMLGMGSSWSGAVAGYERARARKVPLAVPPAGDPAARAKAIRAAFSGEQSLVEAFGAPREIRMYEARTVHVNGVEMSRDERGRWQAEPPPEQPIGIALDGAAKDETFSAVLWQPRGP